MVPVLGERGTAEGDEVRELRDRRVRPRKTFSLGFHSACNEMLQGCTPRQGTVWTPECGRLWAAGLSKQGGRSAAERLRLGPGRAVEVERCVRDVLQLEPKGLLDECKWEVTAGGVCLIGGGKATLGVHGHAERLCL